MAAAGGCLKEVTLCTRETAVEHHEVSRRNGHFETAVP